MAIPTLPTTAHELSPAELGAWRGLLRVHAALCKALDAELEAAHGVSLSSYEVLIHLRAAPDRRLRMADLADRAVLSRSGMTRLVDRLERAGLLVREQCPADARGCYAALTAEGATFLNEVRPTHLTGVRERFLSHFSEDELLSMGQAWERVQPGATAD